MSLEQEFIERAVAEDPDLLKPTCSPEVQLQHLVFKPLCARLTHGSVPCDDPYLIVTDGLDECADEGGIATFINFIIAFFFTHPGTPLRIFITSQVEELI